jgi:hypothetical protein
MTPKDALMRRCALPIVATIVLVVAGCAQQASHRQEVPALSPTVKTNDAGGWYLIMPPKRAYASDRSPMMGGPLATSGISENRGAYSVYSLTQDDTSAPLSKWQRVAGIFSSEQECEDYKSGQMKQMEDPAWVTKETTTKRYRIVSSPAIRDFLESERCVTSEQLSPH